MSTSQLTAPDRIAADWIAVDWRAHGLTIWAMDEAGQPLADATAAAPQDRAGYDQALADLTRGMGLPSGLPVVAAGPFARDPRAVPCKAMPDRLSAEAEVLFPALTQETPRHLTLGADAVIAGYITDNPGFDGVLCLPGPRITTWAHISAEEVVSFRSVATGTVMAGLSEQPDCADLLTGDALDTGAFADALSDAMSRPENFTYRLASLQAEARLRGTDTAKARAVTLGFLIGFELAATRPYWLGQAIALIGDPEHSAPYALALDAQFAPFSRVSRTEMLQAGLRAAYKKAFG
nr:2-dehydro-3-deoxygalactonokinase [uncultured Celeribacter sp.]